MQYINNFPVLPERITDLINDASSAFAHPISAPNPATFAEQLSDPHPELTGDTVILSIAYASAVLFSDYIETVAYLYGYHFTGTFTCGAVLIVPATSFLQQTK